MRPWWSSFELVGRRERARPRGADALLWACEFGELEAARLLVNMGGCTLDGADADGTTPLMRAAARARRRSRRGSWRAAPTSARRTAAAVRRYCARRWRGSRRSSASSSHGAPADATDAHGGTALHLASWGHLEEDRRLGQVGALPILLRAIGVGRIDARDEAGETALMLACESGHADAAAVLVSAAPPSGSPRTRRRAASGRSPWQ